jgi:phenylalanine-4-hydroxylase
VFVKGFEDPRSFYPLLKERLFPIGHFIRNRTDLSYTPEPDIVHDFYGHIPWLVHRPYADFCQAIGERSCQFIHQPERFRELERLFWFGVEFPLIETSHGRRIFGAGIVSSIGECEYALSDEPEVLPFSIDVVRKREFRIDEMQKTIFILRSEDSLYSSLNFLSA